MDKKRVCIVLVLGVVLIIAGFLLVNKSGKAYQTNLFALDTSCNITLYGDNDFAPLKDKIKTLENIISAYNENSEIYKLNKDKSADLSPDALSILTQSTELYKTYGKVNPCIGNVTRLWNVTGDNPSVPDENEIQSVLKTVDIENIKLENKSCSLENNTSLDFGATGKGYVLDELKKILDTKKMECALISFGSSSLLYGEKPDGKRFSVAVSNPDNDSENILTIETDEGFISTSGGYERYFVADGKTYSHIFDETTGKPVETDLTSVTVKCDSGIKSDFLSTCIFIGGTPALEKWLSDESIEVIAVDENKNVYCSKSLLQRVQIKNENFSLKS